MMLHPSRAALRINCDFVQKGRGDARSKVLNPEIHPHAPLARPTLARA
eukprot:CAMPEP_0170244190 /NCGR_PEP_ID=MMETSP0116_2-20130129/21874_1 /TAXON_ID=400756 /ORGANISM="Durinskia baltica, Strain CSIRO CS-38" /LENGTH=47 /DNA_ID= /DNA_START= /DNA_END= /DNA_ORIENTATION=